MLIKFLRVETDSTDWTAKLYPNSNFDTSGKIAPYTVIENAEGDQDIHLDYPYWNEDGISAIYLQYEDNSGTNPANIWILGEVMS